ncbi:hypothetical protein CBW46_006745 [Paenibacillus xerothermodurans]|uniref:Uncharacterized protein n=1 Tax=Paenibacillus xerothermodurans TaxID=1977292 RepID=A0A2W1NDP5_PAEXE|nr:hypothetical protein CBW46_006745 [Paenibacillus xerothermodurans]
MIILFILFILIMGSFYSGAMLTLFQKKHKLSLLLFVLGIITTFLFYYAIFAGWVTPPQLG